MILIENTEVMGWEAAIRGMRNPMNSWEKSDSVFKISVDSLYGCRVICKLGFSDYDLMLRLAKAGSVEGKFRRMITVYADITA